MGIGYLLLYVALAVVALWLVAEVLLQNRAPLHWRALALTGFLGVAAGMSLGSVVVIGAGAALFAVGQTFVTLAVKRGHQAGWSLRKSDGSLPGPLAKVPLLGALTGGAAAVAAAAVARKRIGEVSAVEETPAAVPVQAPVPDELPAEVPEVEQTAAFEMQELAQDGVYATSYYEQQPQIPQQPQDPYAATYQGGYDQQQWQTQQQPAFAYDQQQPYGGYPQHQQDPYGGYPQQQDQYAGYQQQPQHQQPWDPNAQPQQHQQHEQWQPQPEQHTQGVPQQPVYDQNYGYQQQNNTWHQG
ncbi:hypothetical protein [Streptomyces sp. CBMA156]|uniref:hypothetical protein n=1 Tax=Streptomyces sp. CBMA156 TaxID=1930280 RepID=UPI001661DE22|nr:hypothetical protein [Streptomyces sp. CBMA156]MBD0669902.1 hypothetical protein [Streptomyces sp. CBMA156]